MEGYVAVVLVCLGSMSPRACNEATALDVRSITVANELGCATGWQEIIARSGATAGSREKTYLKTVCRRQRGGADPHRTR